MAVALENGGSKIQQWKKGQALPSGASTGVCNHPEQVLDPTGLTCVHLADNRHALSPTLFFAPFLLLPFEGKT